MSKSETDKMSFNATWSMSVGGMVGGGIFSVLGVVISTAGRWAWLSFVIAGIIALISAHSYSQLSLKYRESGGSYLFLKEDNKDGWAASLSWILIAGYVLTISVYAFTFGYYVSHVFNIGAWLPRVLGFAIIAFLTFINLRGVGDSSRLEIITVWGKLFVLAGIAVFGIIHWDTSQLSAGIEPKNWDKAIVGAATIFMAYEGFQLLSYDYDDINKPEKNMPRAIISSVITVIFIYVFVSLGSAMVVGAKTLIEQKEVALSIVGKQAMGTAGLIIVTIAAAFSTSSAINATLFSTARLMERVAQKKDLPRLLTKRNKSNIPYNAILIIAGLAATLASIGSLGTLVDAASLVFLVTFGIVNFIGFKQKVKYRFVCLAGGIGCILAIILSSIEQIKTQPVSLSAIVAIIVTAFVIRPYVMKKVKN